MKKILILLLLIICSTSAQSNLSIGYLNSSKISTEGVSISFATNIYNYHKINFNLGFEVNFEFDRYSEYSSKMSKKYDARLGLYKYQLNSELVYSNFFLEPVLSFGIGLEDFNRSVDYLAGYIDLYPVIPLEKQSIYYTYGIGIRIITNDSFGTGFMYSWYNLSYKNSSIPNTGIINNRGNYKIYLIYLF